MNRKSKTCPEPFNRVYPERSQRAQDRLRRRIQNRKWAGFLAFFVSLGGYVEMAEAQQAKKISRIGFLSAGSSSTYSPRNEAFRQGLRDLGYAEGKNITIEYRFAEGKLERLPDLAAELVRLKVDVIVTWGTPQLLAAKRATSTIPIVAGGAGDLVGAGLVASLARPGGNIKGLTSISADLVGKQLELLKETVPTLTRVGVLWDAADPGGTRNFKVTEVTAQALGVQVQPLEVRSPEEFEATFKAATAVRARAIIILQTNLTNTHRKRIVELAAKSRLATMLGESGLMDAGGAHVLWTKLRGLVPPLRHLRG